MDPLTPCWCTLCMCAMFSHGGYLPLERKITGTLSNFSNQIYKGIEFLVIDVCHWHPTVWSCFIATISFILEARAVYCLEGSSLSAAVMGRHLSYFNLILLLAHLYIYLQFPRDFVCFQNILVLPTMNSSCIPSSLHLPKLNKKSSFSFFWYDKLFLL